MRKIAMLLCLALMLGMFAGCASTGAYVPTGDGLADYTQPSVQTKPTEMKAPGELETEEDVFTLAYYPEEGFNPYSCTNINNRMMFSLLYQGLFAMNHNYEAEPILCKNFTVSEDLTVYTFHLETATFSDGSALTAEDVAASLQYARDSDYYRGRFDNIGEISALDASTVRVTSYIPYENLPMLLTIPIVKRDTLEQEQPIGSGPYRLQSTASGLILQRNQNWWCKADLPITAESVTLRAFDNPTAIRDAFEFENVGFSTADPGAGSYAEYRCDYELWEEDTGVFLYLACNSASGVFSNPEVRKALTFAIDRALILEEYYNGFGMIATLPASPNSPFYHRGLANKVRFDSAQFEQAVTNAGMRGQEIILYVNKSDSVRLQVAREIARMLTDCGLVVKVESNTSGYYREGLVAGNYDLYLGQTKLPATMDLSEFFASNGALNYGGMTDAACYTLCQDALENSGNFYNLHQAVLDDGQLVPILFRSNAVYGKRGLVDEMQPARDNIFYYTLGKNIKDVKTLEHAEE